MFLNARRLPDLGACAVSAFQALIMSMLCNSQIVHYRTLYSCAHSFRIASRQHFYYLNRAVTLCSLQKREQSKSMASSEETLGRQHKRNDYFSVRPLSQVQEILLNAVLFSAQGTTQSLLAQGILPDQVIGRSFGAKSEDVAWFPAAYGLTAGTLQIQLF